MTSKPLIARVNRSASLLFAILALWFAGSLILGRPDAGNPVGYGEWAAAISVMALCLAAVSAWFGVLYFAFNGRWRLRWALQLVPALALVVLLSSL